MKRTALAFAPLMLIAGFAALNAGSASAAQTSVVSSQAAHHGSYAAARRGPYAAAGRGPNASPTRPGDQAPPPSIPYDADGPAYMPGQHTSTDFQLQH